MRKAALLIFFPLVLAALSSAPAIAQVQVGIGFGPLEVRMYPDAPPPRRHERRPAYPGYGYVWIGGFWDRDGDRWAWRDGRWDRPPHRGVRWIAPRHRRDGEGYRHEPGHWSNQRVVRGESYNAWQNEHRRRDRSEGRGRDRDRSEGHHHKD